MKSQEKVNKEFIAAFLPPSLVDQAWQNNIQKQVGKFEQAKTERIVRVNEIAQTHPTKIQSEEIPRMHMVMKNFTIYRWVEIILLLAGIITLLFFHH
jgi:hypothetical protein